jgi:hypothetical protein
MWRLGRQPIEFGGCRAIPKRWMPHRRLGRASRSKISSASPVTPSQRHHLDWRLRSIPCDSRQELQPCSRLARRKDLRLLQGVDVETAAGWAMRSEPRPLAVTGMRVSAFAGLALYVDKSLFLVLVSGMVGALLMPVVGDSAPVIALLVSLPATMTRALRTRLAVSADGVVKVRNGLRSYSFHVDSILRIDAGAPRRVPPRIRIVFTEDAEKTRNIYIDATARMRKKSRVEVYRHIKSMLGPHPGSVAEYVGDW